MNVSTKIVCRLLNAAHELIGWTTVYADARGDGQLWSPGAVSIVAERAGFVTTLSLHWCDLHVETRVPLSAAVVAGQRVTVYADATPMLTVGPMPGPLPAVTVGSVAVAVPVGAVGARG